MHKAVFAKQTPSLSRHPGSRPAPYSESRVGEAV